MVDLSAGLPLGLPQTDALNLAIHDHEADPAPEHAADDHNDAAALFEGLSSQADTHAHQYDPHIWTSRCWQWKW